jgi:hypothetical protein
VFIVYQYLGIGVHPEKNRTRFSLLSIYKAKRVEMRLRDPATRHMTEGKEISLSITAGASPKAERMMVGSVTEA